MYRIVLKVIFAITSELRGIYEYRTMQSMARNIIRSKVQYLNFDVWGIARNCEYLMRSPLGFVKSLLRMKTAFVKGEENGGWTDLIKVTLQGVDDKASTPNRLLRLYSKNVYIKLKKNYITRLTLSFTINFWGML